MVNDVIADPLTVANQLRPALLRLARELRQETEQLGVTSRQVTLLWLIRNNPGMSLRELALTDEGERLLRRVRARRTTWLADRLRGLDDDELAAVEAAIEPLGKLL